MIRRELQELVSLGPFPASSEADKELIQKQEELLRSIKPPVSDEEAKHLVRLFGPDDYFGGAWTVVHLVETAPHWPISECLTDTSNEWIVRLQHRARRGRVGIPESNKARIISKGSASAK
jgi:hypothetical protein